MERLGHGALAGEDTSTCRAPARSGGSPRTLYSPAYAPPAYPHSPVAPVSREAADASTPPMLKHWREVKAQHPETILFYRVGDFYEMFHEDAELAARVLESPSPRAATASRSPACRSRPRPTTSASWSAPGHRVAICEQVEDPKLARGLVRREVVETVTPGAMLQEGWLAGRPEQLPGGARGCGRGSRSGSPRIDLSTGEFLLETLDAAGVRRGAGTPGPARRSWCPATLALAADDGVLRTVRERWEFDPDLAREELARRFALASLDGLGVGPDDAPAARRGRRPAALPHRAPAGGPPPPRPAPGRAGATPSSGSTR